jgi:hypothetical protein
MNITHSSSRPIVTIITALLFVVMAPIAVFADDIGTAFTYQGDLQDGGAPVSGDCDFEFTLWDAASGGNQIGSALTDTVEVADGRFTAKVDFGADAFLSGQRFLQIQVCCPSVCEPGYTLLDPRQELTPTPYALGLPALWATTETVGLSNSANVVGGYSENSVLEGAIGATISGGGGFLFGFILIENEVTDNFGTVGGGTGNRAGDVDADPENSTWCTVAGGNSNIAEAESSTVGGGNNNTASGLGSTICGGFSNEARGLRAAVPGGQFNHAGGDYSFAAGRSARVRDANATGDGDGDEGTFVWADSTPGVFTSTGPDQFLVRASGGVGIGTESPSNQLTVAGDVDVVGNLGINTPSPAAPLHLSSDGGAPEDGGIIVNRVGAAASSRFFIDDDNVLNIRRGVGDSRVLSVTGAGDVGIGTTDPTGPLHVVEADDHARVRIETTHATSDADIDLRASGGERYVVGWDESGEVFRVYSGTQGGNVLSVQDSSGNVGIGTDSPTERLHVVGNVCATGTIGACSDRRFKKNVSPIPDALDRLSKLRGVEFDWKRSDFPDHEFADERQIGFIAQEVEDVLPEVVSKGATGYHSVDYGRLTPVLVEAIKGQQGIIENQRIESRRQRKQITDLHERLARLEALLASSPQRTGGAR